MQELSMVEVEQVGGAGWADLIRDLTAAAKELPRLYDALIEATSDMMCRATGNC